MVTSKTERGYRRRIQQMKFAHCSASPSLVKAAPSKSQEKRKRHFVTTRDEGYGSKNKPRSGALPSHKVRKLAMGGVLWTEFLGIFRHGLRRVWRRTSAAVADSCTIQAIPSLAMAPKPRLFFLTTGHIVIVPLALGSSRALQTSR